ncbi:MAG: Wzz/FepE/Etk N-terminal domain-containing protein, partial [Draconibacterium sp.]|nr:Wzz/FepE/Etk N-terminal domain-containing protein [Draconibacterium sp.]
MTQTEIKRQEFQQMDVDDSIDIKKIIFVGLRNWYWFVICSLIAGAIAYLYNRYTIPVYEVKSTILFEEEYGKSSGVLGELGSQANVFQGLGGMNSMRNIYNQVVIISSTPIVAKTLQKLDFEISYYSLGRIKETEAYKSIPFRVIWDRKHPQLLESDFYLAIQPDGKIQISADLEDVTVYNYDENNVVKTLSTISFSRTIEPGVRLTSEVFSFKILLNEHFNPNAANTYKFRFHSTGYLVEKYRGALEVSLPDDNTTIIQLLLHDYNMGKAIDFLNKLAEVYQIDNLSKKNENANRTIQFINSQLQSVSDSLNISETRMESFQSENQVLDISLQSQQLLNQMTELDNERVAMVTQNKYYHYLKDYIVKNQELETVVAPSAMGIQDPLLNSLILQLNDLITQKSSQTSIRQDSKHPTILRLNAQIESVKISLLENTNNIIQQSDIALTDLNSRIRRLENLVRRLPATERNYVNIERDYKLNNEIYTFLLQKLSEAQIAMASNTSDSQVIEIAAGGNLVAPKTKIIYIIALLLGLGFPMGIIFLRNFFNNKIESQEEVEAMTNFPIIGHVFHNEREFASRTLVLDKPNSPASEPYRAIRNKLNLMTKGKQHPVISVTSTFPKEGKSYNVIN